MMELVNVSKYDIAFEFSEQPDEAIHWIRVCLTNKNELNETPYLTFR